MDVVTAFPIAIGVIGLLVGGAGRVSKARQDSIVEALTKDNVATKDYAKTLETQLATQRATCEEKDKQLADRDRSIEDLKRQNRDLIDLGQGSPQLKKLTNEISKLVKASTKQSEAFVTLVNRLGKNGKAT